MTGYLQQRRSYAHHFWSIALFICALGLSFPFGVSAQIQRYLTDVPSSDVDELLERRSVSRAHDSVRDVVLAPAFPGVDEAIRNLRSINANIVSERLILVEASVSDAELVTVFNALLAVSELSYLEYYNPEREKWNELFYDSYRVADSENLDPLPDIQVDAIPNTLAIPVFQEVPPFGDVLQSYRYESIRSGSADGFAFSSRNEWDIRYRRIRVVKPEEMITYAWVIRDEDYLLLYGIGAAKVFTGLGLFRDRIENSFISRTDGLFDWLSANYLSQL